MHSIYETPHTQVSYAGKLLKLEISIGCANQNKETIREHWASCIDIHPWSSKVQQMWCSAKEPSEVGLKNTWTGTCRHECQCYNVCKFSPCICSTLYNASWHPNWCKFIHLLNMKHFHILHQHEFWGLPVVLPLLLLVMLWVGFWKPRLNPETWLAMWNP